MTSSPDRPMPAGITACTWGEISETVRTAVTEAIRDGRWPIYLHGPPGVGKSCAAACLYRGWKGFATWFETGRVIADVLECRCNGKGFVVRTRGEHSWDEWESSIKRKCESASLVCFDDVGLRRPSEAGYEVFFALVELRTGKPTIFTGNLPPKELATVYDDRLASRILRGTVIHYSGDDRRLAQAKVVKA